MRVPIRCRWFHKKHHRHVTDGNYLNGACLKCGTEFMGYGAEKKWPKVARADLVTLLADAVYRKSIKVSWGGTQSVSVIDILRPQKVRKEIELETMRREQRERDLRVQQETD